MNYYNRTYNFNVTNMVVAFLMATSLLTFAICTAKAEEPPQRITSISQCTDVFAVNLADPSQIQSLTYLSSDPEESLIAEQAQQYAYNVGSTEDAILANPDLVLAGPWTDPFVLSQLQKLGVTIGKHASINSLESLQQEYPKVGAWVGHPDKATKQVNTFLRTVNEVSQPPLPEKLRYVIFGTGGYIGGNFTLQSEIFSKMGLVNIAEELGVGYGGFISLETLLLSEPDLIFIPEYRPNSPSVKAALAKHPAMKFLISRAALISDSSIQWRCFNPVLNDYLRQLRTELDQIIADRSQSSAS